MPEGKVPRCIAYLSESGDIITLELTSGPKFTERDVEAIVIAMRADRAELRNKIQDLKDGKTL